MVGQSAGSIYRFLKELDSTFEEIDREATVDELLAHVAKVRERAKSPVDQRALDLLSMLAEQRAAEVKNQPGAARRRSCRRPGPRQQGRVVARRGATVRAIARRFGPDHAEHRCQTSEFASSSRYTLRPRGQPQDRLLIAHALAESLLDDNHRQRAIDVLEPALAEHRQANGGKVTWVALDTLRRYGDQIAPAATSCGRRPCYRGELARAANEQVAFEIRSVLYRRSRLALCEQTGRTSLGEGVTLYRAPRRTS